MERCLKEGISEEEVLKEYGIYVEAIHDKKLDTFKKKSELYSAIHKFGNLTFSRILIFKYTRS